MKYLQFVAYLFLCTSYTCQAMKLIKKKKKEVTIKSDQSQNIPPKTVHIGISAYIKTDPCFERLYSDEHPIKQNIETHFIIKGIEWDDIQLIRKGIKSGGDINYANPTKNNLNFIQIACKEKSEHIVWELLRSTNINIKSHKTNTDPALHLVVKKGSTKWEDLQIIKLLIKHDPTIINIRDNNGNRAIDLVCNAYNACYKQYIATKSPDLYKNLINQEWLMHTVLSVTSPYTECVLFKPILEQEDAIGLQLPKELIAHIVSYYYALSIETVIGKKKYTLYCCTYYNLLIEQKIAIRQQLFANPEPKLLWSTS